MKCLYCHERIDPAATSCPQCGLPVHDNAVAVDPPDVNDVQDVQAYRPSWWERANVWVDDTSSRAIGALPVLGGVSPWIQRAPGVSIIAVASVIGLAFGLSVGWASTRFGGASAADTQAAAYTPPSNQYVASNPYTPAATVQQPVPPGPVPQTAAPDPYAAMSQAALAPGQPASAAARAAATGIPNGGFAIPANPSAFVAAGPSQYVSGAAQPAWTWGSRTQWAYQPPLQPMRLPVATLPPVPEMIPPSHPVMAMNPYRPPQPFAYVMVMDPTITDVKVHYMRRTNPGLPINN